MKIIYLSLLIFIADQLSKVFVRGFSLPWFNVNHKGLNLGESIPVINNFFHLTLIENPGIAFGIDPGPFLQELILVLTIATCFGLFTFLLLAKNTNVKIRISIALILGGAAGNLFDRTFYGYFYNYASFFQGNVVDFLDVKLFKLFMFDNMLGNYVFNIADLSVTTGVIVLIFLILKLKKESKKEIPVPQVVEDSQDLQ